MPAPLHVVVAVCASHRVYLLLVRTGCRDRRGPPVPLLLGARHIHTRPPFFAPPPWRCPLLVSNAGTILGLTFETTNSHLARIRIECDMSTQNLLDSDMSLYHHVFEAGVCAEGISTVSLKFSSKGSGVWAEPEILGASGCQRIRLWVQGGSEDLLLTDFVLDMDSCPAGQYKVACCSLNPAAKRGPLGLL